MKLFTKSVLETALNEEMTEHLGHEKNQAGPDRDSTNVRNGTRSKTVISDAAGEVLVDVPRDREGTFEPKIVKKRQRRLSDVDEVVLSLYAKGLTTGEISAHFDQIYGASISKETISRITDKVIAEMNEWASRPLALIFRVADVLAWWVRLVLIFGCGPCLVAWLSRRGAGFHASGVAFFVSQGWFGLVSWRAGPAAG